MEISNLKGLEKGKGKGDSSSHIVRIFQEEVDASLTWEFVTWMREVTNLPVFVKVGSSVQLCCLNLCTCAGTINSVLTVVVENNILADSLQYKTASVPCLTCLCCRSLCVCTSCTFAC